MAYLRLLQQLRHQFEELTDKLNMCQNSDQRKELLKRMKAVIDETDKLITKEVLQLDSTSDRSNPQS
jgi:predicted DNA-binding protein YlxM (UPF0122 family)